jgi:inner membrane protein
MQLNIPSGARLFFKIALIFVLTLLLLIPLAMTRGVIQDRQAYRQQAVQTIARSSAGEQALLGPVLIVPYTETVELEEAGPTGARVILQQRAGQWVFFPTSMQLDGTVKPRTRQLGLHKVRVYTLQAKALASMLAEIPADTNPAHPRRIGKPWLSWGISDVRGIVGSPRVAVDGRVLPVVNGFGSRQAGGLHVRFAPPKAGEVLKFDTTLDVALDGTESLALVPIASDNRFSLTSAWPHPRFGGSFPPTSQNIDGKGFRAHWAVSNLASSAQRQFLAGATLPTIATSNASDRATVNNVDTSGIDAVGVSLVDPVNVYVQADRATKYGVLFVVLTFVGFFMFEMIKQLRIHPIQYGLVGLALAIFFLLLVSLSEHIAFGIAYVVSAAACIGLLGFYLSAVLRSAWRGIGFAAMLTALYAALYGLLVSEDNALVLGACLLFAILAGIMIVTRRVDWYALQSGTQEP